MTNNYPNNQERTGEYLKKFNRENVLKLLVNEEEPIIFDIGANNGTSLKQFKEYWPKSKVHCFEPQNSCWETLQNSANQYSDNSVFINRVAAGEKESSSINFYTHDISDGLSGFYPVNLDSKDSISLKDAKDKELFNDYSESFNHRSSVPMIRLENYILNEKIESINLLKIDTQGYEPQVLSGLGQMLQKIDVVISELIFYDYYDKKLSFSDLEKFLLPAGFSLYDISHISKNPMNGRTDWVDVIYINERIIP